jgi:hypothetical protein
MAEFKLFFVTLHPVKAINMEMTYKISYVFISPKKNDGGGYIQEKTTRLTDVRRVA